MTYKTYLASREWALRREAVRQRSGNRCERCKNGPQDAVHHLTYANVGNEPLEDLQAICDPCHEYLSGKNDFDPAYKHPAEIACEEWETQQFTHVDIPHTNYCIALCENCKGEKLCVFKNSSWWGMPECDFDNFNSEYGTFWLHGGEAYCDHCGKDAEGNTFVELVQR